MGKYSLPTIFIRFRANSSRVGMMMMMMSMISIRGRTILVMKYERVIHLQVLPRICKKKSGTHTLPHSTICQDLQMWPHAPPHARLLNPLLIPHSLRHARQALVMPAPELPILPIQLGTQQVFEGGDFGALVLSLPLGAARNVQPAQATEEALVN